MLQKVDATTSVTVSFSRNTQGTSLLPAARHTGVFVGTGITAVPPVEAFDKAHSARSGCTWKYVIWRPVRNVQGMQRKYIYIYIYKYYFSGDSSRTLLRAFMWQLQQPFPPYCHSLPQRKMCLQASFRFSQSPRGLSLGSERETRS